MNFQLMSFSTHTQLCEKIAAVCRQYAMDKSVPKRNTAILLSGGKTPLPAYQMLTRQPPRAISDRLHFLFSDDRLVPENSPDSNYANARPMIQAFGVSPERVMRVNPLLSPAAAARDYGRQVQNFLDQGGCIRFGLLGLGSDGHTASLFTITDAKRTDTAALPVTGHGPFNRVSLSAAVLTRVERLVIVVSGKGKEAITRQLLSDERETLPAYQALAARKSVELWADFGL